MSGNIRATNVFKIIDFSTFVRKREGKLFSGNYGKFKLLEFRI